jgi:hypothetical protein
MLGHCHTPVGVTPVATGESHSSAAAAAVSNWAATLPQVESTIRPAWRRLPFSAKKGRGSTPATGRAMARPDRIVPDVSHVGRARENVRL